VSGQANAKNSRYRKSTLRTAALSIAGLVVLLLLVWFVDPSRVAAVLRNADPAWLFVVLIGIAVAAVLGAANAYLLSAPDLSLEFHTFLGAYWGAWALGQVVPGQVGDLIGISLFLRRRGLALPKAMGRLGVDKLVSLFCMLTLSTGLIAIYDNPVARVAGGLGACAATVLLGAYFFSLRWKRGAMREGSLVAQLTNALHEAHFVLATRPRTVAANAILTVLKLLVIGFCYWAMLLALHEIPGNLMDVVVTANSVGLIAYVPISANGLGTVEAGGLYLFGLHGLAPPVIIAMYLGLRAANLALALGGTALILMVNAWRAPSNDPLAMLTLAETMACCTEERLRS